MADKNQKKTPQPEGQKEPMEMTEELQEEQVPVQEGEPSAPEEAGTPQEDALAKLQEENTTLTERNLRLMAEFDNYRNRTQRERESIYPDAVANTLKEFLPVLDNFQRALETACSDENYAKGVEMIYHSLWEIMKNLGVEEIGTVGEPFDPNFHNAVMHIDDQEQEKNVISQVFQKGYKMKDRVLRHAMVQVAN